MQRDAKYAVDNNMTVSAGFLSLMTPPFDCNFEAYHCEDEHFG